MFVVKLCFLASRDCWSQKGLGDWSLPFSRSEGEEWKNIVNIIMVEIKAKANRCLNVITLHCVTGKSAISLSSYTYIYSSCNWKDSDISFCLKANLHNIFEHFPETLLGHICVQSPTVYLLEIFLVYQLIVRFQFSCATFWRHVLLILKCQGTNQPPLPLKNPAPSFTDL